MSRLMIALALALIVSHAYSEQILKLPSGDQYLGNETVDHSGIFVDCDKRAHRSADGELQRTGMTCVDSGLIILHASAPALITLSPLKVVAVDLKKKQIQVLEGQTTRFLDFKQLPAQSYDELVKGSEIGVVTEQQGSERQSIVLEAVFDRDFAVDAKEKQEQKIQQLLSHPDKGT